MVGTFIVSLLCLLVVFNAARVGRLVRSRGRSWADENKTEIWREFFWLFVGCMLGSMIFAAVCN